jgi:hypothetical protein
LTLLFYLVGWRGSERSRRSNWLPQRRRRQSIILLSRPTFCRMWNILRPIFFRELISECGWIRFLWKLWIDFMLIYRLTSLLRWLVCWCMRDNIYCIMISICIYLFLTKFKPFDLRLTKLGVLHLPYVHFLVKTSFSCGRVLTIKNKILRFFLLPYLPWTKNYDWHTILRINILSIIIIDGISS